jgi:hypothetical protein
VMIRSELDLKLKPRKLEGACGMEAGFKIRNRPTQTSAFSL